MRRFGCLTLVVLIAFAAWAIHDWGGAGPAPRNLSVTIQPGTGLAKAADQLEKAGAIRSASRFVLFAKIFGGGEGIKAGEFGIPAHLSQADILKVLQGGKTLQRFVTIPEGMPSIILASIVEKETALASERRMVAAVYSNRLKRGMMLQADPTIIYPITFGKALGRRILLSEKNAKNDYNTYTMTGLPKTAIVNPGRGSLDAVLDPADSNALYFVANGTGGSTFADTLEQHNINVQKWYAIRRARGEM